MKNKLATKGRNQMGHKDEPKTTTENRNCAQQTNNDYFYAADRDLGDNDSDKYVWLKDTWSYMDDRELVTQLNSEQKDILGSTTIILEGIQTKKRKNRGKKASLVEITKKIKNENGDKKVIVVADAMVDGHSFFIPHAKIKCDDELCFNSQPAIDVDRQSVTRFIELMKAMEYIDLI